MKLQEIYEQIGDYDSAMKRLSGNCRILEKYIKRFPTDKSYENLIQAYLHDVDPLVYRYATTLCEVCDSLSLTKLGQTARVIAEAYTTGEAATRAAFNVPMLMETLEEQYNTVIELLKNLE